MKIAFCGASAASTSPALAAGHGGTLRTGKLVYSSLRAQCWRSAQITETEKNALGQALYHVVMNPVTWCASNGKISSVNYTKGTAAADKKPWGFDKWLAHGKVGGGVGSTYVEYREDAQFKAVLQLLTIYGHVFIDASFYPNGTYGGTLGGN